MVQHGWRHSDFCTFQCLSLAHCLGGSGQWKSTESPLGSRIESVQSELKAKKLSDYKLFLQHAFPSFSTRSTGIYKDPFKKKLPENELYLNMVMNGSSVVQKLNAWASELGKWGPRLALVCVCAHAVVSDSLWPHGLYMTPLSMGILQTRILEWVAMPFSRRSSQPRTRTQVFWIAQIVYRLNHQG